MGVTMDVTILLCGKLAEDDKRAWLDVNRETFGRNIEK
jgi:hypothetical protein